MKATIYLEDGSYLGMKSVSDTICVSDVLEFRGARYLVTAIRYEGRGQVDVWVDGIAKAVEGVK